VTCPTCGKLNSADTDVCSQCGTHLKEEASIEDTSPGDAFSTQVDRPSPASSPPSDADDFRDFFSDLADEPEEEPVGGEAATPDDDAPDWFPDSLSDEAPSDDATTTAAPAEALPDWLTEDTASSAVEATPDWLAEDTALPATAAPVGESESPKEAEPEGDALDWLSDDLAAADEAAPGAAAEPAEDLPEWLSGIEPVEPSETSEPSKPEAVFEDWLEEEESAEPETTAPDAESEADPAVSAEPEMPDWLSEVGAVTPAASAEAAKPEVVSDDWLDGILGAEPEQAEPEAAPFAELEATPPSDAESVAPDEVAETSPVTPAESAEAAKSEVVSDDWLDGILGAEPEQAEPEAAPTADAVSLDDDMPDWLVAAKTKVQTGDLPPAPPKASEPEIEAVAPAEAEAEPAPADDMPEWLGEAAVVDDDAPDWLQAAGIGPQAADVPTTTTPTEAEAGAPAGAEPAPAGEVPDWLGEAAAADDDMPDWLKGAEAQPLAGEPPPVPVDAEAEGEAQPVFDAGALGEDAPDWLRDAQPQGLSTREGVVPPATEDGSPFEGSLFDWLDEEQAPIEEALGATGVDDEASPLAEPVDLESGELPDWLHALRPEEAGDAAGVSAPAMVPLPEDLRDQMEMLRAAHIPGVLDPDSETHEETVGPLKGVMGVVSAAPIFASEQRLAATSTSVAVEVDSSRLSLLQAILSPDEEVRAGAAPQVAAAVGRVLITLLLLAAIALPITMEITPFDSPDTIEMPAADAARSLIGMGPSPNVLLAFEYDPSHAGELNVEAKALISTLMMRDATLYAVSTQPTGPAIAQDLLEGLAREHGYVYGEGYVNLGYVSGNAAGVRGLVTGVTSGTVSPLAFDYQGTPTEFGNARLDDLDIDEIVLFAGTPEAVRIWVEQAGTPSGIPMVAAVGASTEPMTLPYYHQGRQLEGVVSGLAGATRFTLATQDDTQTLSSSLNARWNAQVAGALAAGMAIVVGIIVQIALAIFARRQQGKP
jgi:hypothetical protein